MIPPGLALAAVAGNGARPVGLRQPPAFFKRHRVLASFIFLEPGGANGPFPGNHPSRMASGVSAHAPAPTPDSVILSLAQLGLGVLGGLFFVQDDRRCPAPP